MTAKMNTGGVPREVLRERERVSWDLRQRGWTHERISVELNLERSTVSKILNRVSKRYNDHIIEAMAEERATQVARLNLIVDESMRAWERSKAAKKLARKQQTGSSGSGTGSPVRSSEVVETRLEDRDGDPRYLDTAMKAMADIRRILGLDAPLKSLAVDLKTLTDAQLDRLAAGADIVDVLSGR